MSYDTCRNIVTEMELDLQRDVSAPLYLRLTTELRRQVESGVLKPGDRLPSFAQLRDRYGIHKNTVERAHLLLEQDGLVVREQGRGTFVAARHSGAATQIRKDAIGFCGVGFLLSNSSSYWVRLLEGVWAGLAPAGKGQASQLLLLDDLAPTIFEKADGVLVNAMSFRGEIPEGLPCISLLATNRMNNENVSSVLADDYAGARAATRHLLELGHRRIAYLCSGTDTELAPRRLAGYRDALQEYSVAPDANWVRRWKFTPDINFIGVGRENMMQWLREGWKELGCTAILAHNDEAAVGVMEALNGAGYEVPRDVSVVGFDGTELSESAYPRLTTVEVPLREIGQAAVEILLRQIEGDRPFVEHLTLPTKLHVRESSASPR